MTRQRTRIGLRYAAHSDSGTRQMINADAAYAGPRLIAVADGTGGRRLAGFSDDWPAPEPADQAAARVVIQALRSLDRPALLLPDALAQGVTAANGEVRALNRATRGHRAGATLTAMLWSGRTVALAHIGDSRGYVLRDGGLFQMTKDHSTAQSLDPEAAEQMYATVQLSRALDGRDEREPDLQLRESLAADRYLLCSDGLSRILPAQMIFEALSGVAPAAAAERLIEQARRHGGPDNITCVVADVVELDAEEDPTLDIPEVAGAAAVAPPPSPSFRPPPPPAWSPLGAAPGPPRESAPGVATPTIPEVREADFTLQGYDLFERLGEGGNATVYRGRHLALGRDVAVKVINRRIDEERDRRRFRREVDATVRLSEHPSVVTLYDADTLPNGHPYLVMELCPGGSLSDRLRREGALDVAEARDIGVQIADAVAAAHELGVLHRDIKPANLLVTRFKRVALADFGIAALPVPGVELSVTLAMTPVYAAPEVFDGAEPAPAADIYALGATLYALLAGRSPRDPGRELPPTALIGYLIRMHDTPIPDIEGVPESFMSVLRTALASDPAARHRTAADLRDALAAS